jgi:23S rRNA (cytosine1962-C5)-methyltransferase
MGVTVPADGHPGVAPASIMAGRVYLKRGRDGPVRGGNPWIFSQAIERFEPADPEPGATVEVRDATSAMLGYGYCNPATTIAVRMLSWGEALEPGAIVEHRITRAVEMRRRLIRPGTDSYRLVNGDGDGLSGVVIDRYADVAVVQLLTAGAERMREQVVAHLTQLIAPRAIIERSQGAVRRQEGLEDRTCVLAGEPVEEVVATEHRIRLAIDPVRGQKTGYFLDQRDNRARLAELAAGARVLDACCYAGGFALAALGAGAKRVVGVDTSARALEAARRNLELNGHGAGAIELVHGEAAKYLAESGDRFDLIVLDPPPLARSRADAPRSGHLYAELNARALAALAPGGCLMTFSCSVHFRGEDFIRAVRIAQTMAGRHARTLARLGAGADHPVLLGHVEGEYLTGVLLADLA